MKAGTVEFLTKPFRDQELLDAVQEAIVVTVRTAGAGRSCQRYASDTSP